MTQKSGHDMNVVLPQEERQNEHEKKSIQY
jgi:hypothetical protein